MRYIGKDFLRPWPGFACTVTLGSLLLYGPIQSGPFSVVTMLLYQRPTSHEHTKIRGPRILHPQVPLYCSWGIPLSEA